MARKRYNQSRLWRIPGVLQFFLFLVVACGIWIALNIGAAPEYFSALAQRNQVKSEVAQLQERVSDLKREQAQQDDGGFSTEKRARVDFLLAFPGEKVVFWKYE